MQTIAVPIFEAGLRAVACPHCRSISRLELEDSQVCCRDCNAIYWIVDGVLDLMPPGYRGYQGDSKESATLRNAHDPHALRDDTVRPRVMLDQLLRPKALVLDAGCGTGHLATTISESNSEVTIIATDVSLPMSRLAAKNCRDHPIMVVRSPTSKIPPMPFRKSVFDIALRTIADHVPTGSGVQGSALSGRIQRGRTTRMAFHQEPLPGIDHHGAPLRTSSA